MARSFNLMASKISRHGFTAWFTLAPSGPFHVAFDLREHQRACALLQQRHGFTIHDPAAEPPPELTRAAALLERRLEAYLSGQCPDFYPPPAANLPASPLLAAATAFQQQVWRLLTAIPPGETRTYGEIAAQLPQSHRRPPAQAVGRACGANPCPLLIPCHRVVASRHIGGFGGGLEPGMQEIKRYLLNLERRQHGRPPISPPAT